MSYLPMHVFGCDYEVLHMVICWVIQWGVFSSVISKGGFAANCTASILINGIRFDAAIPKKRVSTSRGSVPDLFLLYLDDLHSVVP